MFMDSFKYYKARNPVPDFKDVIDVDVCADEIVSYFLKEKYHGNCNKCFHSFVSRLEKQ